MLKSHCYKLGLFSSASMETMIILVLYLVICTAAMHRSPSHQASEPYHDEHCRHIQQMSPSQRIRTLNSSFKSEGLSLVGAEAGREWEMLGLLML